MSEVPLVWRRPMVSRAVDEPHRASTPLELFFDLCFVVAVAAAAGKLHHAEGDGAHLVSGLLGYAMVFFAIWWAWMNFTWFASAYDTGDISYRLAVFVMITGALILAAGVPRAFDSRDFVVVTIGYCVMRTSLVGLWLRAAHDDPPRRVTARRFAVGITLCQLGWVALLFLPEAWRLPCFGLLVVAELCVPFLGEASGSTSWHPGHIAERYALFTLIVLGESVLSGSVALGAALDGGTGLAPLWGIAVGGLLLVFSMWWKYFARPAEDLLTDSRLAFVWGYGHLVVYAAAAAVGAGLAVAVDQATGLSTVSPQAAAAAVTVPVAVYVVVVWWLHLRPHEGARHQGIVVAAGASAVLASTFAPQPILVAGLCAAIMVGVAVWLDLRRESGISPDPGGARARP
jgi:low temperature requirement protein LtrA